MRAEGEVIRRAIGAGADAAAIECYARWWQLETYVRELVYTELRTKFGGGWAAVLGRGIEGRAHYDAVNSYMASADAESLLAYADSRALFGVIEQNWALFEPVLPTRVRWRGLSDTLLA